MSNVGLSIEKEYFEEAKRLTVTGNYFQARILFQLLIELRSDAASHYHLGCVLIELHNLEKALFHFKKAVRIKPDIFKYKQFYNWYCILYQYAANNKFEENEKYENKDYEYCSVNNLKCHKYTIHRLLTEFCPLILQFDLNKSTTNKETLLALNEAISFYTQSGLIHTDIHKMHIYKLLIHQKTLWIENNSKCPHGFFYFNNEQKQCRHQHNESGLPTMSLSVKLFTGKVISLSVDPKQTIFQTMKQIESKVNIPVRRQKIMFDGKQICPTDTLFFYVNIRTDSTLYLTLQSCPNTLINNIYIESINWMNLYNMILSLNIAFDLYLTKIIYDYAPFVDLHVSKQTVFCNSGEYDGACSCISKPFVDNNKVLQHFIENVVCERQMDGMAEFYGLFLKFEFEFGSGDFVEKMDVTDANIAQYIEIKEMSTKTLIKYRFYNCEKIDNKQSITVEINVNFLKSKRMLQLFGDEKCIEISVLIKENELLKSFNVTCGLRIGNIAFKHYIFLIR